MSQAMLCMQRESCMLWLPVAGVRAACVQVTPPSPGAQQVESGGVCNGSGNGAAGRMRRDVERKSVAHAFFFARHRMVGRGAADSAQKFSTYQAMPRAPRRAAFFHATPVGERAGGRVG